MDYTQQPIFENSSLNYLKFTKMKLISLYLFHDIIFHYLHNSAHFIALRFCTSWFKQNRFMDLWYVTGN